MFLRFVVLTLVADTYRVGSFDIPSNNSPLRIHNILRVCKHAFLATLTAFDIPLHYTTIITHPKPLSNSFLKIPLDGRKGMVYITATMKFLKLALVHIPEQVISTLVLGGFLFVMYRGVVSMFADPPSTRLILATVGVGIVFGLITSVNITDAQNIEDHD